MEILERMIDERRDVIASLDDLNAGLPALSFKAETNERDKKKLAKARRDIAKHNDRLAVLNPAIEGAEEQRLKAQAAEAMRQLDVHKAKALEIHRERVSAAKKVDNALADLEAAITMWKALTTAVSREQSLAGLQDPTMGRRQGRDLLGALWSGVPVLAREIGLDVRGRHRATPLADASQRQARTIEDG